MVPIHLKCQDCGHEWRGKPLDERDENPRCGDCGSREVKEAEAGPGFDPNAAVGGGEHDERATELKEALRATPGVGEAGAEYAAYWFSNGVDGPEDLHDLLLELGSVDQQVSRRIVTSIYGDGGGDPDAPAPFAVGGSDGAESADSGEADTLDAIIKAKQAGLLGGDDDGGVDSAEVAEAVAEAINPAIQQMAQAQAALAEGDGEGEVEALRREVEQLREEREKSELQRLEEKIEQLEGQADPDSEIQRLRETRDMLESAPSVSAEAADEWGDVAHSLLDRLTAMQRQRELLGAPDVDDRQPTHRPAAVERGQRPPAQAPRERPAPGPQATADGGTAPGGGRPPAGGNDADRDPSDGEPTDSEMAERVAEVRESLGIAEEEDSE